MLLQYFTLAHILISLVGIAAGFGVLSGMIAGKLFRRWTAWFLVATILTSVTGFLFPFKTFTPALGTGIFSMLLLAPACYALYGRRLAGAWCGVFVITSVIALYLNCFVLIVQLFQKFPALREISPEQTSPVFGITQGIVLLVFIVLGVVAKKRFRGETPASSPVQSVAGAV